MISKSNKDLSLGLLLMVLPTIFISFPLLDFVSEHYTLLFLDKNLLIGLFSGGLVIAYLLHSSRLRFLIVFSLLLLGVYLVYQSISAFPFTEFDAYYIANRFRINAAVFVAGWFTGFGIARWRYFLIFYATLIMGITVATLPSLEELNIGKLIWIFAPPILYAFYILFIKELLYNIRYQADTAYHKVFLRAASFIVLIFLLFWGVTQLLESKFDAIEEQLAGKSENEENDSQGNSDDSMLDQNDDNLFRLKDYTELRPRLRQSNELLFCAYIDNFFPNNVPNPQYITLYHLNQYNVDLERFEIDPDTLVKDVFLPDPTTIPNYFVQYDSSVLRNDRMDIAKKPVTSTMYISELSPDVFVAPSTAYACQPISVEEEFKDKYRFAYNVTSEVSTLNSAYFVYNAREKAIQEFQKERNAILREVDFYDSEPEEFMEYYTRMPAGETYKAISNLADSLTQDQETAIDKIIAIRDYFLSKDDNGNPLFTYTLTPGSPTDPNIPDASLLHNFLFNTHKGYCTYFATASLFMLRSLDIPVRMAVGFMTIDRSHNNPGWYWFYADQAHAWTQVYFPEYGWLDFDFTISNEDAEEAPQPDATPPTPPTDAPFVGIGTVQSLDTAEKSLIVALDGLLINQQGFELEEPKDFSLDAVRAKVFAGKTDIKLGELEIGDSAVVVSFEQSIKNLRRVAPNETTENYLTILPAPVIIDEIHTGEKEEVVEEEKEEEGVNIADSIDNYTTYLIYLIIFILLLLLISPYLHHLVLLNRIKAASSLSGKSVAIFQHAHLLLNQMGLGRGNSTPMNYATQIVDPRFGTNLQSFIESYLKLKYGKEDLSDDEKAAIKGFYPNFNRDILKKFKTKDKFLNFLKFNRWFYYLANLNLKK